MALNTNGPEIARAYVTIMPSMKGVGAAVNKEFGSAGVSGAAAFGGGMLGGLKGFGATLLATVGVGAITQGFTDIVNQASDLNEANNALNVTYGATADQLFAIRENSASLFGLSKLDFSNAAVQMSNFASTIGGPNGAAGAFNDIASRATDFASVMNLEVSDALALFQSGLAGETEPLRRYGVDVSAATVQAYAYANGIAEQGAQLTQAQKVQAAWGAIVQQTNGVQGDFLNTSDQLANSQRILSARWQDAKASLGTAFLPVALKFTGWLESAIPYVEQFAGWMNGLTQSFDANSAAANDVTGVLGFTRDMWAEVAKVWRENVQPQIDVLVANFKQNVQPQLNELTRRLRDDVKPAMEQLSAFMQQYGTPILRLFADEAGRSANIFFSQVLPALIKVGGFMATGFGDSVRNAIDFINMLSGTADAFKNAWSSATGSVKAIFKDTFNAIAKAWNTSVGKLNFTVPDWVPNIGGKSWGMPKIPQLAEGGIVTKPTIALIGEGRDSEAVIPLPKLEEMLSPGTTSGGQQTVNIYGTQSVDELLAQWPIVQARLAA